MMAALTYDEILIDGDLTQSPFHQGYLTTRIAATSDAHDMRECLFLSAAIILLATPRLWAGSTMAFQLGEQGGVIVPVMVNGSGPFRMLLDTGATHSAITEDVAALVQAKPVARTTVITPAGNTLRTIVAVDRIHVGSVTAESVLPSVIPARALDPEGKIQGLIGQDVLARLRYTLDFKDRTIEWHQQMPSDRGVRLPLAFEHGRFLVALQQDRGTLRLVPDSGAGAFVLFDARGGAIFTIPESSATVELSTAHTTSSARPVRVRELRVGDRIMRDVPAVTIERADRHPAEGDGLLPLHLFERVTFDGPGRILIVG
jgi:predicted aspartyl protease